MIGGKFWKNRTHRLKISRKASPLSTKNKIRRNARGRQGEFLSFVLAIHFLFGIALSEADDDDPVLSIKKTDSVDPVKPGDSLTYTIHYSNSSDDSDDDSDHSKDAKNVVIVETYDPNVTFVSASPPPDVGNNQWNIGTLKRGHSGTITVTVTVNTPLDDGTELLNKVSIESDKCSKKTAQEITTVRSNPVLGIKKIHSVDPVAAGANLTYTITYSNATSGTEIATNTVIKETYDPNVTFVSASPPPDLGSNNQWTIGTWRRETPEPLR